jgi:hypothetical protein
VVVNRNTKPQEVSLTSSCHYDRFDSPNFSLSGLKSRAVKLSFGVETTRIITCGQSRLELKRSYRLPHFEGDRIVVEDDAFVRCCLVYPDHAHEFEYLRTREFHSRYLPIVITEKDQISPPAVECAIDHSVCAGSVVQIAIDPVQGVHEYIPPDVPPRNALVLWGEDRASGNPSFIPLFQVSDTNSLSKAVTEIEAIHTRRSQQLSLVSTAVLAVINSLLIVANRLTDLKQTTVLFKTRKDLGPFSCLLLAIHGEAKRTERNYDQVVLDIVQRMRKSPKDIPPPPDPWKGTNSEGMAGLTMVWYTVLLLDMLIFPNRITQVEIDLLREELTEGRPSLCDLFTFSTRGEIPEQPVTGDVKTRIGVVARAVTDAESGASRVTSGLIEIVQQKLDELIRHLVDAQNPRAVHDELMVIPSLAMQASVTARYPPDVDLSKLLLGLENVTCIILAVGHQKEHLTLFRSEIQAAIEGCIDAWCSINEVGIRIPQFE